MNTELHITLRKVYDGQAEGWHFDVAPISKQNRGGCGTRPTLEDALQQLAVMVPRILAAGERGGEEAV